MTATVFPPNTEMDLDKSEALPLITLITLKSFS